MKAARFVVTIALFLFVGATVGTLVAQEVARPGPQVAEDEGASSQSVAQTVAAPPESPSGEAVGLIPETTSVDEPVVATVGAESVAEPRTEREVGNAVSTAQPASACVVDAIYFHNTFRCATCMKIERDARAAIEAGFPDQLASGTLRWSAINMEDERQYVSQYELTRATLVLVRSVGGEPEEWLALDDTWTLIGSATKFSMYIADGLRAFLDGCP